MKQEHYWNRMVLVFSDKKNAVVRTPVDLTIEQTINKHAKSNGGIIGFSRSLPAYYRWTVTRHNRAQYVSALLQITDIESKSGEI